MKIPFLFHGLWLSATLLSHISCNAQDPVLNPDYETCCGQERVEYEQDKAYVYIPNVFTPNGDGHNDRFVPIMNDQIVEIWEYSIYVDTIIEPGALIYSPGTSFTVTDLDQLAWDGTGLNGKLHEGAFEYRIVLSLRDGTSLTIDSRACSIVCGPGAGIFQTKDGCFFQSQVTDSKLNIDLPNNEEACFK
jgi:hypothetical protein